MISHLASDGLLVAVFPGICRGGCTRPPFALLGSKRTVGGVRPPYIIHRQKFRPLPMVVSCRSRISG
jgi:hypothetical protein